VKTRAALLFAILMLLAAASVGHAAAFPLTRNGKPAATIVIAAKPTVAARFAAAELQYHVQKITGATLPIVSEDAKVSGPRILVGESAATRTLRLRSRDFKSQEYMIRISGDTLVLIGRDAEALPGESDGPQHVEGKFGKALRFDGEKAVVSVPDCALNDDAGTLEAWFWMPAAVQTRTHGTILRIDGSAPWTYHIIQRDMGTSTISYTTYDGTNGHSLAKANVPEGWHHVVGTWDAKAGKMALFIDGESCGTTSYVKTTCKGCPMGIGGMPGADRDKVGNPFNGIIDEVRVSSVVRDPATDAAGGPYTPDANTTALFHFDEADGPPVDSAGTAIPAQLPGLFDERGTVNAAYDFLERFCDVRWYAPGEIGLSCPSKATLAASYPPTPAADGAFTLRRKPFMVHRWITPTALYMPGPPDRIPTRDVDLWKLRMRIGGQPLWICHSFYGYYDRFLKDHPDWFAQGYSGQPPQMCYTNEGFIKQVIQDANDYFDGKGAKPGATAMGDFFGLVPMDNNSWCKCPECQAELNKAQMGNLQFNNGKASDYVFGFVNKVATEIRKSHPDKWIGALAYSDYAYYPEKVKLQPNVLVQMCLHTRNWWCPSMEANDRKVLREWRAAEPNRPLYLWLYYCFPALNAKYGDWGYFPGYFAHTVVRQMKMYKDANIRGIFMEHSGEFDQSYLMDQLEFYVTLKLADNPDLDGNKLIDDFFTRYYGSAAKPMKELYCRIEDTFSNPKCYPVEIQKSPAHHHQTEELAWGSLGTEARMAEFAKLMEQAKAAAKTPIEKQRVAMWEKGQWDYMVAGRKRYVDHSKNRAQAPPQVTVPKVAPAVAVAPTILSGTNSAAGLPRPLDRVDWSKALDLGKWGSLGGDPTDRKVASLVAHDDKYLYVQLSEDVAPDKLVSTPAVWDGDDWELFFAQQRSQSYRQFCVSPAGKIAELAHGEAADDWKSGAAVVSDTATGRWTVRLAFPLDKLIPGGVKPGAKLYANFYRASPGANNLLAWTPTFAGGFQDTSRLAELTLE